MTFEDLFWLIISFNELHEDPRGYTGPGQALFESVVTHATQEIVLRRFLRLSFRLSSVSSHLRT